MINKNIKKETLKKINNLENNASEKGFTLIELIIVSVLLAILGGLLYRTINGVIQAKNIVESEIEATSRAQFILEKIGRELSSVNLGALNLSNGSGSLGLSNVIFLGQKDRITFNTSAGGQIINGRNNNYGSVQVSYYLESESKEFSGRKTFKLIREELPSGITDEKTVEMRRSSTTVINSVEKIAFRFYSRENWADTWDQPNLPEAVEILLLLKDIENTTKAYKTAYSLGRQR